MPPGIHHFAEKVAVISDIENAIGRAAALQLALQGCFVIGGVKPGSAAGLSTVREFRELGTLAGAVECDITTAEGAAQLISEAEATYGRLDLLVNSRFSSANTSFPDVSEIDLDQATADGWRSTFFVTQYAVKLMRERPKPKIVNITSADGGPLAASAAAAVHSLTTTLAAELPGHFRINCVSVSQKPAEKTAAEPELFRPSSVLGADDAARVVLYLLSAEAIGLNGQIITAG